jgi:DNA-binding MarR family transcriptional regulator
MQKSELSPTGRLIAQALTANDNRPMSSFDLALVTGSSPATIALVCRDLTKRGVMARSQSDRDRRTTVYAMTTTETK